MKRILCILHSLTAGGAETFLMKICRSLPAEEYQIDFIVSEYGGCYEQEVLERGAKIHQIPQRKKDFFGAFGGIKRAVKENKYDVVLKLGENSLAVFDLIAARMGGAKTLALRSCNAPTNLSWKARIVHGFFRPLLNIVSTVKLAPSQLAADFMFGKKADVTLLHNGVDFNVFRFDARDRADIRAELSIGDNLLIGHIGRFHAQKNHRFLLEIFKRIQVKREDALLLLIGTGDLETEIKDKISELGLQNNVVLLGQRFDIPRILSAMDVFVFPSFYEGMPNTVIEAQATGLPCVIADTITKEANITGLVQYLSLEQSPEYWAETALAALTEERKDTAPNFLEHGYDINGVAKELIRLLGC